MDLYSLNTTEVLERISRHCPSSLSTYLHCLNRADAMGKVYFSRHDIEVTMSESYAVFRNNIKKLARENLLEWHPFDGGIAVTLADIDENA